MITDSINISHLQARFRITSPPSRGTPHAGEKTVAIRLGPVELRLGPAELRLGLVEIRLGPIEIRLGPT